MKVFVVGGTGFLGRPVVESLAAEGYDVVALARHPQDLSGIARVETVQGDLAEPDTYRGRIAGCRAGIHLVGLLRGGRRKYDRVVSEGTRRWVAVCKEAGLRHLVYVSAVGARPDGTNYQRTKWEAEEAVRTSGLPYTILRPSIVIGPGGFLQQMAGLMRLRLMPVFGRGDYPITPIARQDVVQVVTASLSKQSARNRMFHLGGPQTLSYLEMLRILRDEMGIRCALVRVPKVFGHAAAALLGWLPFFPATRENLTMLFEGNVASEQEWRRTFGIAATPYAVAVQETVAAMRSRRSRAAGDRGRTGSRTPRSPAG